MTDSSQGLETFLTRTAYEPESVAVLDVFKNLFILQIRAYKENGDKFVVVRLAAKGIEALCEAACSELA